MRVRLSTSVELCGVRDVTRVAERVHLPGIEDFFRSPLLGETARDAFLGEDALDARMPWQGVVVATATCIMWAERNFVLEMYSLDPEKNLTEDGLFYRRAVKLKVREIRRCRLSKQLAMVLIRAAISDRPGEGAEHLMRDAEAIVRESAIVDVAGNICVELESDWLDTVGRGPILVVVYSQFFEFAGRFKRAMALEDDVGTLLAVVGDERGYFAYSIKSLTQETAEMTMRDLVYDAVRNTDVTWTDAEAFVALKPPFEEDPVARGVVFSSKRVEGFSFNFEQTRYRPPSPSACCTRAQSTRGPWKPSSWTRTWPPP